MKDIVWMFSVFFGLIYVPPVLMLMMVLTVTDIPLYYAATVWLPFSVVGTLLLSFWYQRQGNLQG
ncbi:hypothetical protein SAMN02745165_01370 [Malonomonas rubra DSM 5091]|uniref:Uncharacterized protein n=1 Tax=Malonomonas rubra DSM 5091 TaxID=1122189 RepID=A0A1M6G1P1_MALRU|nr:hypothetical protein [Malonomonas rubra]SHJ03888.1 hypothetical protein SAMN02745165_01370 [Malonomonas rubra DSM 5091]